MDEPQAGTSKESPIYEKLAQLAQKANDDKPPKGLNFQQKRRWWKKKKIADAIKSGSVEESKKYHEKAVQKKLSQLERRTAKETRAFYKTGRESRELEKEASRKEEDDKRSTRDKFLKFSARQKELKSKEHLEKAKLDVKRVIFKRNKLASIRGEEPDSELLESDNFHKIHGNIVKNN